RVGLGARLRHDLRRLRVQPLQLLLRLLRVVERLANRVLTRLERLQERPPRELREQPQQDEERDDRPDEEPGICLDHRVVHRRPYFRSTISSVNTSARIATPSRRKSGRFTAPVILSAAAGCRAMPSAAAAANLPMPIAAPITISPRPRAAPK